MKKRILSLIIAVVMIVLSLPLNTIIVYAATDETAVIAVESTYAVPGSDVDVKIVIKDNPGIAGAILTLSYDSKLTLTNAVAGDAFGVLDYTAPGTLSNPCNFSWDSLNTVSTATGTILTLTFRVSNEAEPNNMLPILLSYRYGDFYDGNLDSIVVEFENGSISVIDYIPGDVNNDGVVNGKDVTLIRRYNAGGYDVSINEAAADVNNDGVINGKDVTLIRRYIAGGYDVELKPSTPVCSHSMHFVDANEATCTENGNIAYWYCTNCGKYFSDADGKTEISPADTVIQSTGHSYSEAWSFDDYYHWHSATCEHLDEINDKSEHSYGTNNKCTICNAQKPNTGKLAPPIIKKIENDVIYWHSVNHATNYTVRIKDAKGIYYYKYAVNHIQIDEDELVSCPLKNIKDIEGNTVPTANYGYIQVSIKADSVGDYEESDWTIRDNAYFYIPDSDYPQQDLVNLCLGCGFNLNENEFVLEPGSNTYQSVLNLAKLLSLCDEKTPVRNVPVQSGYGDTFFYENADEYIQKSSDSYSFNANFHEKRGLMGGFYFNSALSWGTETGSKQYNKTITFISDYYCKNKGWELFGLDNNYELLNYCFSQQFSKDVVKGENETTDDYCRRIYEKYGTIIILGVETGGVYGKKYIVSTNSNETYEKTKTAFSIGTGLDLDKIVNAGISFEYEGESIEQLNSSETLAKSYDYSRGGAVIIKGSNGDQASAVSEWKVLDSDAIPISLTNNGAIPLSYIIGLVDRELGKQFAQYVDDRATEKFKEFYQQYANTTLPMTINSDGELIIDISSFEGASMETAVSAYLDNGVLTVYPTFLGSNINKIIVKGNFTNSKKLVNDFSIKLLGWARDVNIEFNNTGIALAENKTLIDSSALKGNINVQTEFVRFNTICDFSGKYDFYTNNLGTSNHFSILPREDETLDFSVCGVEDGKIVLPISSKNGYAFVGWQDAETFVATDSKGELLSEYVIKYEVTNLYPIFKNHITKIVLDKNGADLNDQSMSEYYEQFDVGAFSEYECENEITKICVPTKLGYRFKGYYFSNDSQIPIVDETGAISLIANNDLATEQLALKAEWELIEYSITYVLNDGVNDLANPIKFTVGTDSFVLKEPQKEGHSFDGWYSSNDFQSNTKVSEISKGTTGDKVFYAKWTENEAKVTFNATDNGGQCTTSTKTYQVKYGELPEAEKTGYEFNGWYTGISSGDKVSQGDYITERSIDITLYAWFTASNNIIVSFDKQGGDGGSGNVNATYDSAMPSITKPTRTGYTFGGYYTGTNGSGTQYYTASGASARNWDKTAATTLYAKWTANTYTVTLDRQGGSGGLASVTATYASAMPTLTINAPFRTGYTFGGYYDGRNGSGTQYYTASGTSERNWNKTAATTLYAKWTANTYTVDFDQQGGSDGTTSKSATYASAMPSITVPTRTGYTFGGYYTGKNGSGTQYYTASGASKQNWDKTAATTLYANWIANSYYVQYNANKPSNASHEVSGVSGRATWTYDQNATLAVAPSLTGWKFTGWYDKNGNKIGNANVQLTKPNFTATNGETVQLFAHWEPIKYNLLVYAYDWNGLFEGYEYDTVYDAPLHLPDFQNNSTYPYYGWYYYGKGPYTWSEDQWGLNIDYVEEYNTGEICLTTNWNYQFSNLTDQDGWVVAIGQEFGYNPSSSGGSCLISGTLITLFDGTKKKVEDIVKGDVLLTWDFSTGTYNSAPVVFNDSETEQEYTIIYVTFSNETTIGIATEHGFFDVDLGKYIYLDLNAAQYIGHRFVTEQGEVVTLEDVTIKQERVAVYSPVTYKALCYYANGMLSVPGGIAGLLNPFAVDTDTMQYDQEKMQADIELYGLLDYEEVSDIMPEVLFDSFNGEYLNILIGKGYISWETIYGLMERYLPLCLN